MIKLLSLCFVFFAISMSVGLQEQERRNDAAHKSVRRYILSELSHCKSKLKESLSLKSRKKKQQLYHAARKHYKHIEFFVEFYSPKDAKLFINGPLVPKHEPELGSEVFAPQGFQKIEELLFSDSYEDIILSNEFKLLTQQLESIEEYYSTVEINDGSLLEMVQIELFRIMSLNLNGYDATITQTNILESLWCLEGLEKVINAFKPYQEKNDRVLKLINSLNQTFITAKKELQKNQDYNTFDRLNFLKSYVNPLNQLLVKLHNQTNLPWSERKQALNLKANFLFGEEAFEKQFFSIYYDDTINNQRQAKLGKMLFIDPTLSGNNKTSCATCHNPSKAFTDGLKLSNVEGTSTSRNAPTLLNVIYQKAFFYDGRAYQLEQQAFDVIHNETEMRSSLEDIIVKLKGSNSYVMHFKEAFQGTSDTIITPYSVQKALAEYEKTLVSWNSRFDLYLKGSAELSKRELNGYNLFAGKALCGSCHFFPLFNGTVPPYYSDSEFEVIGTPESAENKALDKDTGRYNITNIKEHLNAFKTPTVRNIEATAPYMHNGVYTTLEEVMNFYNQGGGAGLGFDVPNQTLPFDSLQLTETEKEDIILFMKTLTDTVGWD